MPITLLQIPILALFLNSVEKNTGMPALPPEPETKQEDKQADAGPKKLPKGVVLNPDGTPQVTSDPNPKSHHLTIYRCRSCTSFASWRTLTKKHDNQPNTAAPLHAPSLQPPPECPPDVEQLGRSSWTLLHSIAATYPSSPTPQQQADASTFISSFSRLYPCHWCATDFQSWMKTSGGAPKVSSRQEFGQWLCEAHNEVNKKLGKSVFDCSKWEERWRTGWKDGRCD
jgi:mitochondrial FAD-linked sulfhydryl oxidase